MSDQKDQHDPQGPSANQVHCWSQGDPTERLEEMFVDMGQKHRIAGGVKPAQRAVFRKQHGIAYGHFVINPDIDPAYKLGIFAGDHYDCAVRFSSDTAPTSPDLLSTLGVGLKLFGVHGKKLIGAGDSADFIFQNMDRFFVKDAEQMAAFTTAGVVDRNYAAYIDNHPEVAGILNAMAREEASCLTAHYWAILPFKLGDTQIVKYRLVPDGTEGGAPFDNRDYLALDLQRRLRGGEARFRFEIQLRTSEKQSIEDASQVWHSPFICIAKLILPRQDICAIGQAEFGSGLSFNIWRTLAVHEPLGSIAAVRKRVYEASAEARQQANGRSMQEPEGLNPPFNDDEGDDSHCIVYAGIYPPIGVMRVGNSAHEYFIGPEVSEPVPISDEDAYRDKTGALKRQAARFRIYGFNARGVAVKELTLDNAEITWHAHLANQKASWYSFQIALDIPEAADAPPSLLRNDNVADRSKLLIDGGKRKIHGRSIDGDGHDFKGRFMDESVYLGEMRTDEQGRLIMLGGHGKSANINGDIAITFANNEGWYDDTSDGPVTADVKYEGVELRVLPAWVICAPPDFAPMQKSVRTMWDLMRSVAVNAGLMNRPVRPSFTHDILPIFERMTDLQWVNAGFAAAFHWGGQFDYTTEEWKARLGNPSSANYEMRRPISNNFRRLDVTGAQAPQLWPWIYGDAMNIPATDSPRQHAVLSDLQLSFLDQWVAGDFDADYNPRERAPTAIDQLPVREQPEMLTRAAMEFCLADAFHPGCEMTWPMRTAAMYSAPFRLRHASDTAPTNGHYYGPLLNNDVITLPAGPLMGGQVAGGITRWMAIPWQTDTASCRDGYEPDYDPYLPTFWPARVPNNILNKAMYDRTINNDLSQEEREQSFAWRQAWLDDLPIEGDVTYTSQINTMIKHFDSLAVVQALPGVAGDPDFPPQMQVGLVSSKLPDGDKQWLDASGAPRSIHGRARHQKVDLSKIDKANRLRRKP